MTKKPPKLKQTKKKEKTQGRLCRNSEVVHKSRLAFSPLLSCQHHFCLLRCFRSCVVFKLSGNLKYCSCVLASPPSTHLLGIFVHPVPGIQGARGGQSGHSWSHLGFSWTCKTEKQVHFSGLLSSSSCWDPPSSTAPKIISAVSSQSLSISQHLPRCLPSSIPWKEIKKPPTIYPGFLKAHIWTKPQSFFQRTVFISSPSYCLLLSCQMTAWPRYTHVWCLVTETWEVFMISIFQSTSFFKVWGGTGLLVCAGLRLGEWEEHKTPKEQRGKKPRSKSEQVTGNGKSPEGKRFRAR